MEVKLRLTRRRIGFVVLLAALLSTGVAYATIPDSNGVYTACKLNATGTIRLIDPTISGALGRCSTSFETPITWGQKGPKGDSGSPGAKGDKGDPCRSTDPACVGPRGPAGTSSGYMGGAGDFADALPGNAAPAASLSLPAGKFLVTGVVDAMNVLGFLPGATPAPAVGSCTLDAGGTSWSPVTVHSVPVGAFVSVSVQAAITLSEPAIATINCTLAGGSSLRYGRGHLQAVQVDTLSAG
jgi:hypothetical protein